MLFGAHYSEKTILFQSSEFFSIPLQVLLLHRNFQVLVVHKKKDQVAGLSFGQGLLKCLCARVRYWLCLTWAKRPIRLLSYRQKICFMFRAVLFWYASIYPV